MNEVYGVDPSAPTTVFEVGALLKLFDVGEGRFIANFPLFWIDDLRANLSALSDLGAMRAEEARVRLGHALLPTKARFVHGRAWIENASSLLGEVAKLIGASGCPPIAEPLQSVVAWPRLPDSSGAHIARTAQAYAKAAHPLFFGSPTVCLVDPYFRLRIRQGEQWVRHRRYAEVLRSLLVVAAEARRTSCFRLNVSKEIGLEDDPSGSELLGIARDIAEQAGIKDIKLEIDTIDSHARYLLGTRSGLQFDHGFGTATDQSLNHVHWMSRAELEPLLKLFMNAPQRLH